MPALCSVSSLGQLAVSSLLDLVLDRFLALTQGHAEAWSRDLYATLARYASPPLYADLFELLLVRLDAVFADQPELRPLVRILVPQLLGPQLKCLDLTRLRVVADKHLMSSLYAGMAAACPNLERLVMGQSFFFYPNLVADLNQKLEKFTKLKSLKIMYIATSDMLYDLGKLCPQLVELSLKGSGNVGDEAAEYIEQCANLHSLDIQGTKISGRGCLRILQHCPRLEWVEHCPFNCDTDVQIFKSRQEMFDIIKKVYLGEALVTEKKILREATIFGIKNFWLFNPKSEELLLSLLCPNLEKIRLDFVFQDMQFTLDPSPLGQLRNLQTLDLNFYDNTQNELFRKILETCGPQLTTLVFNVCADYRSVVDYHNVIARSCPNLTSLSFIGDYENQLHLDQETDSLLMRRIEGAAPIHAKLEHLTLSGYCTDGRLAWILASAKRIKTIHLDGNLERLSNSSWLAVMADNPLQELESVWFNTSTNMSQEVVEALLNNCPSLRRLGRLVNLVDHRGGTRREMYFQLVERRRQNNWDLDLVWVTPTKKSTTRTLRPSSVPDPVRIRSFRI